MDTHFVEVYLKLVEDNTLKTKIAVNIVVIIISLMGIANERLDFKETTPFERFMVDSIFAPIQKSVVFLKSRFTDVLDYYVLNITASKENVVLKKQIQELNQSFFKFEEVTEENRRLKNLLQFGDVIAPRKVLAQIVGWDASSDYQVLRINKGIKDGVKLQATVVTADGVVGYIYRLTDHFADILTILDPNNRLDGIVKRTRTHGIVEGFTNDKTIMKYVTRTEPVILNDLVMTSGLGNIYPKGLRVGYVSQIERESYGITQRIEITPSVDFSRLEEVIVLISPHNVIKKLEWDALDINQDK
jgi:rod shape-determining protein MreC